MTAKKDQLPEITLRDIVESRSVFEALLNRDMSIHVGHRLSKMFRKATSEVRDYQKLVVKKIESFEGYIREEDGSVKLNPKSATYNADYLALENLRNDALDKPVILEGCLTVSLKELIESMPKTNVGTADEPKLEDAKIPPVIYTPLWWAITHDD